MNIDDPAFTDLADSFADNPSLDLAGDPSPDLADNPDLTDNPDLAGEPAPDADSTGQPTTDESGSTGDAGLGAGGVVAGGGVAQADTPIDWQGSVVSPLVPLQTDPDLITSILEVRSSPGYQQWQADRADGGVIGDVSDVDFWFQQSTGFTCGPAVVSQIIADFTGEPLPNEVEVSVAAAEQGLLDSDGMSGEAIATVLTEQGAPSELVHDQSWEDVAGYLAEGRSVVMLVDSGDYWPGYQESRTDGVDHAVRIVAIDTERGVAILSDPGHPDGQQLEVPLDVLDEAWSSPGYSEDGTRQDRQLIVSESPDPTPDTTGDPYAADSGEQPEGAAVAAGGDPFAAPDHASAPENGAVETLLFDNPEGWVIVPVELAASRIFPALDS